jgi:hypothetical protein
MSTYPSVCGGYGVAGPKGDPGEDGTLLDSWRGEWDPDITYLPGDLVSFEGSVWIYVGDLSVPSAYAATVYLAGPSAAPPDDPWELFVERGAQGEPLDPHWLGFDASVPAASSGVDYLIPTADPLPDSDTAWYGVEEDHVRVPDAGLYVLAASVRLSLTDVPDPDVPTLRLFQISLGAVPVASHTAWTVGQTWATTVTSPTLRVAADDEVRFLVRQNSGLSGSVSALLSLVRTGP